MTDTLPQRIEAASGPDRWRCGHERTPANTKPVGLGRQACRTCFRELDKIYRRNKRATLRAKDHPNG